MCKITEIGYTFNSTGRTVENPDIRKLRKEEILELYETSANAMEVMQIRANLHEIRNEMQKTNQTMSSTLEEMKKHTAGCPINEPKIVKLIDSKIDEFNGSEDMAVGVRKVINTSIISTSKLLVAIGSIFLFMIVVGTIAYKIGGSQ